MTTSHSSSNSQPSINYHLEHTGITVIINSNIAALKEPDAFHSQGKIAYGLKRGHFAIISLFVLFAVVHALTSKIPLV